MNEEIAKKLPFDLSEIFRVQSDANFLNASRQVYKFQRAHNQVYAQFCDLMNAPEEIEKLREIPFMPISFFKSHKVSCFPETVDGVFKSSGTTGMERSTHYVADTGLYEESFIRGFMTFYGDPSQFVILGLLPSYLEAGESSLVYMVDKLIQLSQNEDSGFYLNNQDELIEKVKKLSDKKVILIGVSYALLDLAEKSPEGFQNVIVMETGGMKGRRTELTKSELHDQIKKGLGVDKVHSEYGMTELLSQAYSLGDQVYQAPPWMKVLIRDYSDPKSINTVSSGGINIIDLANLYSCSFIATDDLGKLVPGGFEILGRLDNSDLRGCNLLVE